MVKGLVANWDEDIALIFAPTGKERKPVESIHLVEDLLPMIDIRLMGISEINKETSFLTILKGKYNPGLAYQKSRPNLLPIENMIPYGGSSGGPAFDNEGRVVAVESGPLWSGNEPRYRKDYKGAALASISKLKALFN